MGDELQKEGGKENKRFFFLVLADDLTGALDSGVQLSEKGMRVVVIPHHSIAMQGLKEVDCLVYNTETRHCSAKEAGEIVSSLVRKAKEAGAGTFYKKTDSGLRGNIGVELSAMLEATGEERLHFIPAYPLAGRTTKNGKQYIHGELLENSIFARDPIEPAVRSDVGEIIRTAVEIPTWNLSVERGLPAKAELEKFQGILIYDTETDAELLEIADYLLKEKELKAVAGCAGFLSAYPVSKCSEKAFCSKPQFKDLLKGKKLLVLSGSMNDVTKGQLRYSAERGNPRFHLPMEKLKKDCWNKEEKELFLRELGEETREKKLLLFDSLSEEESKEGEKPLLYPEEISLSIARHMGEFAGLLQKHFPDRILMVIGGETLQGLINAEGITALYPIAELSQGVVLSKYIGKGKEGFVISKSGAFGKKEELVYLAEMVE